MAVELDVQAVAKNAAQPEKQFPGGCEPSGRNQLPNRTGSRTGQSDQAGAFLLQLGGSHRRRAVSIPLQVHA